MWGFLPCNRSHRLLSRLSIIAASLSVPISRRFRRWPGRLIRSVGQGQPDVSRKNAIPAPSRHPFPEYPYHGIRRGGPLVGSRRRQSRHRAARRRGHSRFPRCPRGSRAPRFPVYHTQGRWRVNRIELPGGDTCRVFRRDSSTGHSPEIRERAVRNGARAPSGARATVGGDRGGPGGFGGTAGRLPLSSPVSGRRKRACP